MGNGIAVGLGGVGMLGVALTLHVNNSGAKSEYAAWGVAALLLLLAVVLTIAATRKRRRGRDGAVTRAQVVSARSVQTGASGDGGHTTQVGHDIGATAGRDVYDVERDVYRAERDLTVVHHAPPTHQSRTRPEPSFELALRPQTDEWVHLLVTNHAERGVFTSDITRIEGSRSAETTPFPVKWRDENTREMAITNEALIDLARFLRYPGPDINDDSSPVFVVRGHGHTRGGWVSGYWELYSFTKPDGFVVEAADFEPGPDEDMPEHAKLFFEEIILTVRVTRADSGETSSAEVRLGFGLPRFDPAAGRLALPEKYARRVSATTLRALAVATQHRNTGKREVVYLELASHVGRTLKNIRLTVRDAQLLDAKHGWTSYPGFEPYLLSELSLNPKDSLEVELVSRVNAAGQANLAGSTFTLVSVFTYKFVLRVSAADMSPFEHIVCVRADWGSPNAKLELRESQD